MVKSARPKSQNAVQWRRTGNSSGKFRIPSANQHIFDKILAQHATPIFINKYQTKRNSELFSQFTLQAKSIHFISQTHKIIIAKWIIQRFQFYLFDKYKHLPERKKKKNQKWNCCNENKAPLKLHHNETRNTESMFGFSSIKRFVCTCTCTCSVWMCSTHFYHSVWTAQKQAKYTKLQNWKSTFTKLHCT